MPLYIAFIDLTNVFDLVSIDGLFQIFQKIGCPPTLQSMIKSFHTNTKGAVQFNCSSSRPFDIRIGVKQGCVLALTLFRILFALLLRQAFGTASEGICLRTRSDGRLFNLGSLRAKKKVRETLMRYMLFADDAAVTTHTQQELQTLMDSFSKACKDFGLTISLKKTNVLGQGTMELPAIMIGYYELDVVEQFIYLGSTITDSLSLDTEIDKKDWEGSYNTSSPHFTSVDQPQTGSEDQDGSVQCLCRQHTDLRQREVDHICQTAEKIQFLPPEKNPPYPWHILARPSKHVHPAQKAQAALAWSCLPHGERPHPKRHSL